jgi:hypothetical protein
MPWGAMTGDVKINHIFVAKGIFYIMTSLLILFHSEEMNKHIGHSDSTVHWHRATDSDKSQSLLLLQVLARLSTVDFLPSTTVQASSPYPLSSIPYHSYSLQNFDSILGSEVILEGYSFHITQVMHQCWHINAVSNCSTFIFAKSMA